MLGKLAIILAALLLPIGVSEAREAEPIYGEVALEGGFYPDPWTLDLVAGGDRWAGELDPACEGMLAGDGPDVALHFSQPAVPLHLYLAGEAPVALAVRLPTGTWRCSGSPEQIARLTIGKPIPGTYHIWSASADGYPEARLSISELALSDDQLAYRGSAAARFDVAALDEPRARLAVDVAALQETYTSFPLLAGGPDSASDFSPGCVGRLDASAADLAITLDEPVDRLGIWALSEADTALAVLTADGEWHCDDDTVGHNPAVTLYSPDPGEILVWVSTWGFETAPATLHVRAGDPEWMAEAALRDVVSSRYGLVQVGPVADEPLSIEVQAGGSSPASSYAPGCAGNIQSDEADIFVDVLPGLSALSLYAMSEVDLTLVVVAPDGVVHCDDDTRGTDPAVRLSEPTPGVYAVWIGLWGSQERSDAMFFVTTGEPDWRAGKPQLNVEGMSALEAFRASLAFHEAEDAISFAEAEELPGGGFELRGVVMGPPELPDERISIARIRVNRFDMQSIADPSRMPQTLDIVMEGIDLSQPLAGDPDAAVLFGDGPAVFDLALDYHSDAAVGRSVLERLMVRIPDRAAIEFKITMNGAPPDPGDILADAVDPESLPLSFEVASVEMWDAGGLMRAALEEAAAEQGMTVAEVVDRGVAELWDILDEYGVATHPDTEALVTALAGFVRDYDRPRRLTIGFEPAEAIELKDLIYALFDPSEVWPRLGFRAIYQPD